MRATGGIPRPYGAAEGLRRANFVQLVLEAERGETVTVQDALLRSPATARRSGAAQHGLRNISKSPKFGGGGHVVLHAKLPFLQLLLLRIIRTTNPGEGLRFEVSWGLLQGAVA